MGIAHGAANLKAFRGAGEKVLGILCRVDVLDEQFDIVFGSDVAAPLERLDAVGVHSFRGQAGDLIARLHDEACAFELAARRDEIAKRLEKGVARPSVGEGQPDTAGAVEHHAEFAFLAARIGKILRLPIDRKSTRLNSSHGYISYAVFCLKKKNTLRLPSGNRTAYDLELIMLHS